jgi:hypothetical protein
MVAHRPSASIIPRRTRQPAPGSGRAAASLLVSYERKKGSGTSGYWTFETPHGRFVIAPQDGRFVVFFEGEGLGSYHTASQALDDLVSGSVTWPSIGNPALLGLPEGLSEWDFVEAST